MKHSVGNIVLLSVSSLCLILIGACTSYVGSSGKEAALTRISQSDSIIAGGIAYTSYGNSVSLPGEEVLWNELNGKPLVLNFWAGSCPPCKAEMPDFQELHETIGDRVKVIGIDVGQFSGLGSKTEAEVLLESLSITYETGFSSDPAVMERYGILAMPTTVFIRDDGTIARTWAGIITGDKLDIEAEKLLSD